jgi:hypothetical protein
VENIMSEDSKGAAPGDIATSTPEERLGRRLFIFRAAAVLGGAAAATAVTAVAIPRQAQAQGCSDRDPNDLEGRGRSCSLRGNRWCTDRDPMDPRGRGRRCR